MSIAVTYQPSVWPLGTEDGITYVVYPSGADTDEEGQHGRRSN